MTKYIIILLCVFTFNLSTITSTTGKIFKNTNNLNIEKYEANLKAEEDFIKKIIPKKYFNAFILITESMDLKDKRLLILGLMSHETMGFRKFIAYNHNSIDYGIMMLNSHNIKRKAFRDNFFPDERFWAELGIEKDEDIQYMYAGIKLLKHHIEEYGDLKKALMVYNGGPKVFRKADADLKEKTSAYAEKVLYNLDLLKTDLLDYKARSGLIPVYNGYTISAENN